MICMRSRTVLYNVERGALWLQSAKIGFQKIKRQIRDHRNQWTRQWVWTHSSRRFLEFPFPLQLLGNQKWPTHDTWHMNMTDLSFWLQRLLTNAVYLANKLVINQKFEGIFQNMYSSNIACSWISVKNWMSYEHLNNTHSETSFKSETDIQKTLIKTGINDIIDARPMFTWIFANVTFKFMSNVHANVA